MKQLFSIILILSLAGCSSFTFEYPKEPILQQISPPLVKSVTNNTGYTFSQAQLQQMYARTLLTKATLGYKGNWIKPIASDNNSIKVWFKQIPDQPDTDYRISATYSFDSEPAEKGMNVTLNRKEIVYEKIHNSSVFKDNFDLMGKTISDFESNLFKQFKEMPAIRINASFMNKIIVKDTVDQVERNLIRTLNAQPIEKIIQVAPNNLKYGSILSQINDNDISELFIGYENVYQSPEGTEIEFLVSVVGPMGIDGSPSVIDKKKIEDLLGKAIKGHKISNLGWRVAAQSKAAFCFPNVSFATSCEDRL